MQFLADENFPIDSVIYLRQSGHKVDSIQETSPALGDSDVLYRAVSSESILLTFDRDFGDLIFNHHLPPPRGIIYFRFDLLSSEEPAIMLLDLMGTIPFEGYITVITRGNLRQRELPK